MFTKVSIDWWKRHHTSQVLDIHRLNFGNEAEDEKYFLDVLGEEGVVGCVGHKGGDVLAFMIYELFQKRLDILHFEVHPEWIRRGIGTQMFGNLIVKCQEKGRTSITWVVRESFVEYCLFLRSLGAKCSKIKRDFYSKYDESGYLFEFLVEKPPILETNFELLDLEGCE